MKYLYKFRYALYGAVIGSFMQLIFSVLSFSFNLVISFSMITITILLLLPIINKLDSKYVKK